MFKLFQYSEFSMNKYLKIFSAAVCSSLALSFMACGDEEPSFGNEVPVAESVEDLSDCNKKNEDNIVYVEEAGTAYICRDGEWHDVDEDEKVSSSSEYFFDFDKSSSSSKTESSSSKEISSSSVIESSSDVAESSSSEKPSSSSDAEDDSSSSSEEPESSSSEEGPKCGSEEYNPVIEECIDEAVVKNELVGTCGPTSTKYNVTKSLCARDGNIYKKDDGYEVCLANGVIGDAYKPTESFCDGLDAIPLCNGSEYNILSEECLNDLIVAKENIGTCGLQDIKYDKTTQFCSSYSLYDLCDGKTYTPRSGYCENGTYYYSDASGMFFEDLRDHNIYKYVKIGDYEWMTRNLSYKVPNALLTNAPFQGYIPYYQYTWLQAMDIGTEYSQSTYSAVENHQGICPAGWHIPSDNEFKNLLEQGSKAIEFMDDNYDDGTNETGFSAYGSSNFYGYYTTGNLNTAANYAGITTGQSTQLNVWNNSRKTDKRMVRCVKDSN